MSDLINRQDAIDMFQNLAYEDWNQGVVTTWANAYSKVAEFIKLFPSAQQEQQWIPSGEKPPEKESYLVWMPFAPPKHRMTVAEYCGGYWNIKTPISAWMPLPKPYEEDSAE